MRDCHIKCYCESHVTHFSSPIETGSEIQLNHSNWCLGWNKTDLNPFQACLSMVFLSLPSCRDSH